MVSAVWNLAYDGGLGLGAAGFGVVAAMTALTVVSVPFWVDSIMGHMMVFVLVAFVVAIEWQRGSSILEMTQLGLILAVLVVFALGQGAYPLSGTEVLRALAAGFGSDPEAGQNQAVRVVWDLRLPRIAAALLVGAALSTAGPKGWPTAIWSTSPRHWGAPADGWCCARASGRIRC